MVKHNVGLFNGKSLWNEPLIPYLMYDLGQYTLGIDL